MYIYEAGKLSGTTKKAIEYYCRKGLLKPEASENGYRIFSEADVDRLKKITLLRSLGVSVEEIRELLDRNDNTALLKIIEERERILEKTKEQNDLLKELAVSMDWNTVQQKAAAAQNRQSVTDRLIRAFPGFWGRYLSLHFGQFLQSPVQTEEQENALHEIFAYLDNVQFEIPEELENEMDELDTERSQEAFCAADEALSDAMNDPEKWLENNKELIEQYLELQKTDEWQNSPGYKLMELLRKFNQDQGYNSVFIPAMRRLSPAYDAYLNKLQKADRFFARQYKQ